MPSNPEGRQRLRPSPAGHACDPSTPTLGDVFGSSGSTIPVIRGAASERRWSKTSACRRETKPVRQAILHDQGLERPRLGNRFGRIAELAVPWQSEVGVAWIDLDAAESKRGLHGIKVRPASYLNADRRRHGMPGERPELLLARRRMHAAMDGASQTRTFFAPNEACESDVFVAHRRQRRKTPCIRCTIRCGEAQPQTRVWADVGDLMRRIPARERTAWPFSALQIGAARRTCWSCRWPDRSYQHRLQGACSRPGNIGADLPRGQKTMRACSGRSNSPDR